MTINVKVILKPQFRCHQRAMSCWQTDNNRSGSYCWVFARSGANRRFAQQGSIYQTAQNCVGAPPCLKYSFGQSAQPLGDGSLSLSVDSSIRTKMLMGSMMAVAHIFIE